jgi:hypothetical protein
VKADVGHAAATILIVISVGVATDLYVAEVVLDPHSAGHRVTSSGALRCAIGGGVRVAGGQSCAHITERAADFHIGHKTLANVPQRQNEFARGDDHRDIVIAYAARERAERGEKVVIISKGLY